MEMPPKDMQPDLCGFGDDQPGRGTLSIIFNSERTWDQPRTGAVSGKRRHDDTISKPEGARAGGFEKSLGRAGRIGSHHEVAPEL